MARECPKCSSKVGWLSIMWRCPRCGKVFCLACAAGWHSHKCPYCHAVIGNEDAI